MSDDSSRPQAAYFDSNIVIGAGWPNPSSQFLELIKTAKEVKIETCLPELVLREVTEHWIRELPASYQSVSASVASFNRKALGLCAVEAPPRLPDADSLRKGLAEKTKGFIDQFRLIPTKDLPASYYTELALRRDGAFADKGKGFHDTIILRGILDDMVEHKYSRAILVSDDNGFRQAGVRRLADLAKVELVVVDSLNTLEQVVDAEVTASVLRYIEDAKSRLLELAKSCETQLVDFLTKALDYTRGPLNPLNPFSGTVSRREFIHLASYVDTHASDVIFKPGPHKGYKFSVDLRVMVRETTDEFRTTDSLGGLSLENLYRSPLVDNFGSKTAEREMAVTVEAEADIGKKGVETIQFISVRETKPGGGLGALFAGG